MMCPPLLRRRSEILARCLTPEGVDSTWSLDFGELNVDTSRYLHPKGMEDIMPKSHGFTYSGIPIQMFSLTQNMDCFVYSMPAIEALENWGKLSAEEKADSDPEWKKLMENLDPESNPIICMLYAK